MVGTDNEASGTAVTAIPPLWGRPILRWSLLSAVSLFVVAVDQLSKALVMTQMTVGEVIPLMPLIDLHYITNRGVAFGLFQSFGDLFLPLSLVIVGVIVSVYQSIASRRLWMRTALAMQIGGAIGNVLDRIRFGAVIDFVAFHIDPIGFRFAIFNVADSAIVMGVVILIVAIIVQPDR